MRSFIVQEVTKTQSLMAAILADGTVLDAIADIARVCSSAVVAGNKIMFCGNGGSAADSQHLAAELVGRLDVDRPGLPAVALTTDTSILTAVSNDHGFDRVFARQVDAIANAGDVLVALSTSGRSPNVVEALKAAHGKRVVTVGLSGSDGREMVSLCDHLVCVPSTETQKIQEGHIVVGHIICGLIEQAVFNSAD